MIVMLALSLGACAQRLPSPNSAQGVIKSYFKSYGKKFENSDFGEHKIDEVEVSEIVELQHDIARATAYVSLDDGEIVYQVGATLVKKTFRWKMTSWENLGKAE